MARKTLGYEELQWTCPNCNGVNQGLDKTCGQCGAPQPDDVKFEQKKDAKLREDDEIKARAKAGADIHCPYCGTRNPGDAKACTQCGGDLGKGEQRETGQVLGAYQKPSDKPEKMVPCPNCGSETPESAQTCAQCGANTQDTFEKQKPSNKPLRDLPEPSRPVEEKKRPPIGLIILGVVICCALGAFIFFIMRTESTTGVVQNVGWERSIAVEALAPVEKQAWRDQIPADGELLSCSQEVRYVDDSPQPNSEEVCGTPYSVDQGSGVAEVVQDCEYQVYDDNCTYSVLEWNVVDNVSISGNDFAAQWPEPAVRSEQRLGAETEAYTVYFDTDQGTLNYSVSDYNTFQQYQIGSTWNLEVNKLGGVVSVSP
jgi:hypothetical protein